MDHSYSDLRLLTQLLAKATSQVENEEIESLKSFELNDDDSSSDRVIESSNMQSKLLHHLVDVSKVVQKRPGDREAEKLLEANNALVNELLNDPLTPAAVEKANVLKNPQATWKEILAQKLTDVKMDPADTRVKELVRQVDVLVLSASSLKRSEDKVTFVVEINSTISTYPTQKVYLRGFIFDISLYCGPAYPAMYLYVTCREIPENMTCEVEIDATIKNHAGKGDWARSFRKVFNQKSAKQRYLNPLKLTVSRLIEREEYEFRGFVKDGKLEIEIVLQAGELVEVKEQSSQETKTETKTETKAETKTETKTEEEEEESEEE